MATTTSISLEGWEKVVSRIYKVGLDLKSVQLFARIGIAIQASIKERTFGRGEDAKGAKMIPYSSKYKIKRQKRGLPTDHVDLFYDGAMWSAFTHTVSENEVRLFFLNTQDKKGVSNAAKAFYNNEDREFFGLTPEDEKLARDIYSDHIRNLTANFNR